MNWKINIILINHKSVLSLLIIFQFLMTNFMLPPFMIISSGFFLFCSDHRPQIKAQYPSLGIGDVAKKLGEQWNSLTDSNKQPYLIKANKLKDKYQKACLDLDASIVFHHATYPNSSVLQYNNICFLCRMLQTTRRRARLELCPCPCPWPWEWWGIVWLQNQWRRAIWMMKTMMRRKTRKRMMMNMMMMNRLSFSCVWSIMTIITISPPLKYSRYGILWWSFIARCCFNRGGIFLYCWRETKGYLHDTVFN